MLQPQATCNTCKPVLIILLFLGNTGSSVDALNAANKQESTRKSKDNLVVSESCV